MAKIWCKDFKTVLKIEIRHAVHDLWDSRIYNTTHDWSPFSHCWSAQLSREQTKV